MSTIAIDNFWSCPTLHANPMSAFTKHPTAVAKPDLESVAREEYAHVYRFCYGLCGNAEEAADAVQQAFLSLTKYQDSVKQWDSIRSWLFTTAKRHIFRQSEKQQKKAEISLDAEYIDESEFAVQDSVMDSIDSHTAVAALQQLDSVHREALVLFYLEECSYEEIAEQLAIPIGTVMSRLYRGKRKLAEIFKHTKG